MNNFFNQHNLTALGNQPGVNELKDRKAFCERTAANPRWVHIGSGNIFRALIAAIAQDLIEKQLMDTGITVCETFDEGLINEVYRPNDNLSLACSINYDGSADARLITAVAASLNLVNNDDDRQRIKDIFRNPKLQLVSFSVTEKAYAVYDRKGELLPGISRDLARGPEHFCSFIPVLTALLYHRYVAGSLPIALVAMDNLHHNGDRLKAGVLAMADLMLEQGMVDAGFIRYLNSQRVSFVMSMIDKITPRPSEHMQHTLERMGFDDPKIIRTEKGSYSAPFTNAEIPAYLVIEDKFPNGRPEFERTLVIMTDRHTVELCENMKIETCLNPLQTGIALLGMVLGFKYVHEAYADEHVNKVIRCMGLEGLKVATDPKVLDPFMFLFEVLNYRLSNPYICDTLPRIALDSSEKIKVRCGLTVNKYTQHGFPAGKLKAVPLIIAAFVRYMAGIDDQGHSYTLAGDPQLSRFNEIGARIKVNDPDDAGSIKAIEEILADSALIGCDLKEHGLYETVKSMVLGMCRGPGSARALIKEYF